ncbi:unnamed protein product [Musa acuminata subsp. malaccensis]|uniref:(wild Malaysian banana) hypothetical protein n=1 Tax=Musa acuminata subsp. malaccensis TaxID=214687 RepID=A0A804J9I1_MUSAM|nr:unnamed protein product [Musa acuminata subsp. malaccensis]
MHPSQNVIVQLLCSQVNLRMILMMKFNHMGLCVSSRLSWLQLNETLSATNDVRIVNTISNIMYT